MDKDKITLNMSEFYLYYLLQLYIYGLNNFMDKSIVRLCSKLEKWKLINSFGHGNEKIHKIRKTSNNSNQYHSK
uniref:Uncharacterized protein n=1 Tax=Chondria sp. (in: red algae) TaxID=1982705 RepID=A0A1Z1MEN8_9FLOR|nr:hypothetical protein [Chondria sp. (in: red algae)]